MSLYYSPKRTKNLYEANNNHPYKLSRSKIDLFINCSKCFYLDRKLGISQPPGFPFSLNSAVDKLLKKEFDIHRIKGNPHPLMKTYGVDAIPYAHEEMQTWRDPFKGISYHHQLTNFHVYGAIDDIWVNPFNELHIVDYKATSKDGEVTIDADWQIAYKRQMEIYQWLFNKNNYKVSNTGYFVYCNGNADKEAFDGKLEFDIKIIPYNGNFDWVEEVLTDIKKCLDSNNIPSANQDCDYCSYRESAKKVENLQKL